MKTYLCVCRPESCAYLLVSSFLSGHLLVIVHCDLPYPVSPRLPSLAHLLGNLELFPGENEEKLTCCEETRPEYESFKSLDCVLRLNLFVFE